MKKDVRREDGDGVPVQAHAAADQLRREPDLPRADRRQRRGRPARSGWICTRCSGTSCTSGSRSSPAASSTSSRRSRSASTSSRASRRSSTRSTRSSKIVRKSEGKQDAADQIIKRFALDAEQTDAILELKIYRLARLEILIIRKELEEKRRRTRQINTLLKDEQSRWDIVKVEIEEIQKKYGDPRRSTIASDEGEAEYTAEDFIVEEDNVVIVSRDGWVKRQKEVKDVSTTRLREGDAVLAVLPGSTRASVVFFSNFGVAYTARITDIPASTGYGEPIQRFFKLKDGERIVAAFSLDPRVAGEIAPKKEGAEPPVHAVAVVERRLQPALQPAAVRRAEHARRPPLRQGGARRRSSSASRA